MELYKDYENIYNLICLFKDGRTMVILLHIFISSGRLTYYPHELNDDASKMELFVRHNFHIFVGFTLL